jgi:glycosyltransferase involved in cell wall biosynthesis
MRIAMLGPTSPYRGGISHYTTLLARELAREHDIEVQSFTRMYPDLLFPGKTQLDESAAALDFPSTRVLDSIDPRTWRRAGKAMAASRPALAVFQWWHPFFAPSYRTAALWLKRHSPRTTRVFLCHNVRPHEASLVDDGLLRLAYSGADAFLIHTEGDREELARLAPGKPIAVHPHPTYDVFDDLSEGELSREEARSLLKLEGEVLLFFGYIRAYKGLRYAIEALPKILEERPVTLVIAGEFYEDRAETEALIDRLGVRAHVRLYDQYIPNEEVARYFRAADLCVQPYVSATQSGITQLAWGFARPVLATAVGGLPEVIDDGVTGYLVPPETPAAIADAVLDFFENERGGAMERAVIEARERFSWPSLARELLSLAP